MFISYFFCFRGLFFLSLLLPLLLTIGLVGGGGHCRRGWWWWCGWECWRACWRCHSWCCRCGSVERLSRWRWMQLPFKKVDRLAFGRYRGALIERMGWDAIMFYICCLLVDIWCRREPSAAAWTLSHCALPNQVLFDNACRMCVPPVACKSKLNGVTDRSRTDSIHPERGIMVSLLKY